MKHDPVNVNSDKMMVDLAIRPPKLEKDPFYHIKTQTEREVLTEMKEEYKAGNNGLKQAMLACIVDNEPICKFNVKLIVL